MAFYDTYNTSKDNAQKNALARDAQTMQALQAFANFMQKNKENQIAEYLKPAQAKYYDAYGSAMYKMAGMDPNTQPPQAPQRQGLMGRIGGAFGGSQQAPMQTQQPMMPQPPQMQSQMNPMSQGSMPQQKASRLSPFLGSEYDSMEHLYDSMQAEASHKSISGSKVDDFLINKIGESFQDNPLVGRGIEGVRSGKLSMKAFLRLVELQSQEQ
jgi:hypothetical protein